MDLAPSITDESELLQRVRNLEDLLKQQTAPTAASPPVDRGSSTVTGSSESSSRFGSETRSVTTKILADWSGYNFTCRLSTFCSASYYSLRKLGERNGRGNSRPVEHKRLPLHLRNHDLKEYASGYAASFAAVRRIERRLLRSLLSSE